MASAQVIAASVPKREAAEAEQIPFQESYGLSSEQGESSQD
jgi:hypothetical protein